MVDSKTNSEMGNEEEGPMVHSRVSRAIPEDTVVVTAPYPAGGKQKRKNVNKTPGRSLPILYVKIIFGVLSQIVGLTQCTKIRDRQKAKILKLSEGA
jgi:hypothetical protein